MKNETNPFSTRWTRPGKLSFVYSNGKSTAALCERLEVNSWRGQIIGPHGSGKSTLLAELSRTFSERGKSFVQFTLREGETRLPKKWWKAGCSEKNTLIVIDGFEQLSFTAKWAIARRCKQMQFGLLITCHQPIRLWLFQLPILFRTHVDPQTVQSVVQQLTSDSNKFISTTDISACCAIHGSNVRELLFDLYDRYERNASTVRSSNS